MRLTVSCGASIVGVTVGLWLGESLRQSVALAWLVTAGFWLAGNMWLDGRGEG